ncbi:MAG: pyruvate kinase [Archaeoglobi archaeon]|nr:pyruvate kinase [Archaeoglobi archaeon]MDK2781718.1 pyruvate kinase [Archaeoglobi archaeon]
MKKMTKIVCTVGPASERVETLVEMMRAGMDVARLNFSHGTHEYHEMLMENIRRASEICGKPVPIIQDLQGPRIRTGKLKNKKIFLREGDVITVTSKDVPGDESRISILYPGLEKELRPGDSIFIADGIIELRVVEVSEDGLRAKVIRGGELGENKGVNLPGVNIGVSSITEKDVEDLKFGIEREVDFIALSFVRSASDILELKKILEDEGADIPIIAKIEKREAVERIDEIIEVSYGVMIARGDLAVETSPERVPVIQKEIIHRCNLAGKPVITATQMLESMTSNPRPTRAEASDVANAVFDGSDALMLSAETASGRFPVESVRMMSRIAKNVERSLLYRARMRAREISPEHSITDAIAHSAVDAGECLGASALIIATQSGYTALRASRYRPLIPIIAVTPSERVFRILNLSWGIIPLLTEVAKSHEEFMERAIELSVKNELVKRGEIVVVTAGTLPGIPGGTNMLRIQIIAEEILRGIGIGGGVVKGVARFYRPDMSSSGEILLLRRGEEVPLEILKRASGVITEDSITSFTSITCRELGIPAIAGVQSVEKIEDGSFVTMDVMRGIVYRGDVRIPEYPGFIKPFQRLRTL